MSQSKWVVTLSDGKSYTEGDKPFEYVEGDESPFMKLRKYLSKNSLEIIRIHLTRNGINFFLPSEENRANLIAFDLAEKPIRYDFNRPFYIEGSKMVIYSMIEAVYENGKLQLYIDDELGDCFVLRV